jgi:hypothetical protein
VLNDCFLVDFHVSLTRADGLTAPVHDTQAIDDVELICTVNVLPADLVGSVLIRYPDGIEYPTTLDSNQHVYRKTVMDVHPRDSGGYTCFTKIQPRPSDSIVDKRSVYSLSIVGESLGTNTVGFNVPCPDLAVLHEHLTLFQIALFLCNTGSRNRSF